MSNIHAQSVKPPARIFFILEDKKLYDQAFWKEILYPNTKQRNLIDFSNLTSYRIRLDCSSANELTSTSDPIPLLSDCISTLRNLIQRCASKQQPSGLGPKSISNPREPTTATVQPTHLQDPNENSEQAGRVHAWGGGLAPSARNAIVDEVMD